MSIRSNPLNLFYFHCIIIRDLIQVIPEWSSGFPYFLQFKSEFPHPAPAHFPAPRSFPRWGVGGRVGECPGNTVLSCLHTLSNPLFYTAMWLWSLKKCGMFFLVPPLKISKVMGAHPSSWGQEQQTQSSKAKQLIFYIASCYICLGKRMMYIWMMRKSFFFPVL